METWKKVALAVAVGVIIGGVAAALVFQYRIKNVGRIRSVGVSFFLDEAYTEQVSSINWGEVSAGYRYGVTLYCKNVENSPVTLSYVTENWVPVVAESALAFSWDYDGSVVSPNHAVAIQFFLDVGAAANQFDSFSFDIVVTAMEA